MKALGGGADRISMYGPNGIFSRAVELVDDESVLTYIEESRTSSRNSRLGMDFEAGQPPATIQGYDVTEAEPV